MKIKIICVDWLDLVHIFFENVGQGIKQNYNVLKLLDIFSSRFKCKYRRHYCFRFDGYIRLKNKVIDILNYQNEVRQAYWLK